MRESWISCCDRLPPPNKAGEGFRGFECLRQITEVAVVRCIDLPAIIDRAQLSMRYE
jgi:hypothetical protein